MAHLQLRNGRTNERILPVYYSDNYISLMPSEMRVLDITVDTAQLHGDPPLLTLDGWNVGVGQVLHPMTIKVQENKEADPAYWPATGLPFATTGLR
jgi:hypothetical protein